ncbi:hypothetical protein Tco_0936672 [Tanacetum coccineum]|uniref:Transposase (Putative), gypsy type n=1 Tax=Tanacetum coccineum TaxID=301880 RepID=A0ABQ5DCZ6_9ASTR
MHKEINTVNLIVGADPTIRLRCESNIPEDLHPELPSPEDTIVDFSEGKVGVYASDRRSQNMDLFNLISAPNLTKVKTGTRSRAAHEVPLLIVTANRVIDIEDTVATATSLETPSVTEKSPLDFSSEDPPLMITNKGETKDQAPAVVSQEVPSVENIATTKVVPEVNLEKEIATMRPPINKKRRKRDRSAVEANAPPKSVSDPDPLSYTEPQPIPDQDIAQSSKGTATEISTEGVAATKVNVQFSVGALSQEDRPSPPPLSGHQAVARRNERIQVREEEIKRLGEEVESLKVVEAEVHGLRNQTKNLETLLEAEVDMKKATEAKNAELAKELESLRAKFLDLQLNNNQLSQQVSTLQAQCVEMNARLDKLSIYIDEELYPHMLMAIVGLAKGMSECLKYDIEHGKAGRDIADVEAYNLEANNKLVKALQDLKDLKYPMVDQLEKLKDAPMELIMASLYLESDTGEDTPQWIRDLRLSSSQLKIPIYPEVRAPEDHWAVKEDVPLEDAIAANISRTEKKNKCRVVCRTHRIGSAHHAKSDGIPVSVFTVVPQGLAIFLTDAGTQTQRSEDEASPRLLRSKSLPPMYNLDWP